MNIKVYCWIRFNHRVRRYEGTTESLSRTGLLVRMDRIGEAAGFAGIGDSMEVDVALPPNGLGERKVMHCTASVARMRLDEKGSWWVTGDIRSMKFRDMPAGLTVAEESPREALM